MDDPSLPETREPAVAHRRTRSILERVHQAVKFITQRCKIRGTDSKECTSALELPDSRTAPTERRTYGVDDQPPERSGRGESPAVRTFVPAPTCSVPPVAPPRVAPPSPLVSRDGDVAAPIRRTGTVPRYRLGHSAGDAPVMWLRPHSSGQPRRDRRQRGRGAHHPRRGDGSACAGLQLERRHGHLRQRRPEPCAGGPATVPPPRRPGTDMSSSRRPGSTGCRPGTRWYRTPTCPATTP